MSTSGEAASGAYKVNSLSGLESADAAAGHLVWDPARSLWNTGMILGALVLGPIYFSWSGLAIFLLLSGFTLCVGHSVGFHRRLIHHSFECPKWLERAMIYVGVLVGMGGPIWTIGLHDIRDWAQRQPDCHWFLRHGKSVLADGFYYLNFRLVFNAPPNFDAGPGISDDRFYLFLQRTWMLHQLPLALLLYWLGGWSWVVWGIAVRVATCFTMHWYIAHVAHRRGPQDWVATMRQCKATTSVGWRSQQWAKAGTATTMPFPPLHGTASTPARSTPGLASSSCWNGLAWRGTSALRKTCQLARGSPPSAAAHCKLFQLSKQLCHAGKSSPNTAPKSASACSPLTTLIAAMPSAAAGLQLMPRSSR